MISEEQLLEEYNTYIDELLDRCDWITFFTGEDVCRNVIAVLAQHDIVIDYHWLYRRYKAAVDALGLTTKEWRDNFDIPEIISLIYRIISSP